MSLKFTTFLELLVKFESFKFFTKLNEIRALGNFSKSAAASGVARRPFSAPRAALFLFSEFIGTFYGGTWKYTFRP